MICNLALETDRPLRPLPLFTRDKLLRRASFSPPFFKSEPLFTDRDRPLSTTPTSALASPPVAQYRGLSLLFKNSAAMSVSVDLDRALTLKDLRIFGF
ncbi:hypothetical protein HanXRQr2_Chr07g0289311 [Helianthus annuus]|uniref:Uncharacterized protein n=1 Tax=Helianthus annuus TaxID=4232 RepID=A0A9K3NF36_HELAN|nr:hypothetical protein HanXRQr2_Chr07g0289311 [Helianthus annuus]KAJ0904266.1 hypothetical protein HanPSC8_Chr07g0280101 [Helianthus annuus]